MRVVFELSKNQFLSNNEIAEQLEISEQTVETHMKRALKIMRAALGLFVYLTFIL
ncbi:hypothetical protein DBR43_09500 [Pedobacter sp. KBW06]|uniref:sigma factor-like helix-turn-helix DNA-binding protein n=1 Tax=Pedobacter sp. KBW06 TaxID=2153359 RepID=UPI000F59E864|nr:hypothetical protein DBR43_09500 [Pedobacter sp. KBW06]